jgi:replication initiation protein RepC
MYVGILGRLSRYPDRAQVEKTLDEMELLREDVLNLLETQLNSKNMHGNAIQNDRHIQNSKPESINELEPSSEKEQGENLRDEPQTQSMKREGPKPVVEPINSFPLGIVFRARPQIFGLGAKRRHIALARADDSCPGGPLNTGRKPLSR